MLAANTHSYFSYSNPKVLQKASDMLSGERMYKFEIITTEREFAIVFVPCQDFKGKCFSLKTGYTRQQLLKRSANTGIQAVLSGVNDIKASSSSVEGFTVTASSPDKGNELKISVEVSGNKTREIYDEVFSKMVDDAQPIPGFRRVKGGKTPNIPENILLEVLGPSKVYGQVIRKVINIAIAEYVAKEGLAVGKDLQIEQSFEDLEAGFEPGDKFRFDAIVHCQDLK